MRRQLINLVMRMLGGKFRSYNQLFMLDLMRKVAFDERPNILSPKATARVFKLDLRSTAAYTW